MTSQRPTLGTRADQPPCEPPAVWCCSAYYRNPIPIRVRSCERLPFVVSQRRVGRMNPLMAN